MSLVRPALLVVVAILALACAPKDPCASAPRLQNDPAADAIVVRLHIENRMHDYFEPTALCILVDDRVVFQPTPDTFIAAFKNHRSIDIAMRLPRGVAHTVAVRANYRGRGQPLDGYSFRIESGHRFTRQGDLFARFVERGDPLTPYEQRPMVEWTDPEPAAGDET